MYTLSSDKRGRTFFCLLFIDRQAKTTSSLPHLTTEQQRKRDKISPSYPFSFLYKRCFVKSLQIKYFHPTAPSEIMKSEKESPILSSFSYYQKNLISVQNICLPGKCRHTTFFHFPIRCFSSHSTVTDFARFRGLSASKPFSTAV